MHARVRVFPDAGIFMYKALACAARSAASKPTRYAGGVNRLYKTTLPPDTCDCSGRKGSETEGW